MKGTFSSLKPPVKEGYFEWYHKNGQIKHKARYLSNKEVGEHLWYHENGSLEAKENYQEGILNGKYEEYYSNGNPSINTTFIDGKQNGKTTYYRKDGTQKSQGYFLKGNRNGVWNYFNKEGKLEGSKTFKTEYKIPEANLFLKLPNDEWELDHHSTEGVVQYIFKRNELTNSAGLKIKPAIMLFIEDAQEYNGDVTLFSINKRIPFISKGIEINSTQIHSDKEYPLSYKNSLFMKTSYTSKGLEHVFYMIHIITKNNKGVQLYLDMTKDLEKEYISEFWTTIRSIKEL